MSLLPPPPRGHPSRRKRCRVVVSRSSTKHDKTTTRLHQALATLAPSVSRYPDRIDRILQETPMTLLAITFLAGHVFVLADDSISVVGASR
jgi:hypothetical protein